MRIPDCDFALIGGSSTLSVDIPENLDLDYVTVDCGDFFLETPYGEEALLKFLR
jgi:5'-methylthioadenosine phosphorylase